MKLIVNYISSLSSMRTSTIFTNVSRVQTLMKKGTLHISFKAEGSTRRETKIVENVKFYITEEDEPRSYKDMVNGLNPKLKDKGVNNVIE